jgi:hypothetical protein
MIKLFPTENLAQLWVRRCLRLRRFNYFVGFRNVGPNSYGISAGWAVWVGEGPPYVKDVFPHVVH